MLIVSVEGRLVRDPATRRIVDQDGIEIDPTDLIWARFLSDGDVAEARAAKPSTKPSSQESAA